MRPSATSVWSLQLLVFGALRPAACRRLIRLHPSASVSIRQNTSEYISIRQHTSEYVSIRQNTSASVSIRQHPSEYVSIRQNTSAYVRRPAAWRETHLDIVYVSIRQHTSAYVSIRQKTCCVERDSSIVSPSIVSTLSQVCSSSIRQHTSAYVSIRRSSALCCKYVVVAYVRIRQNKSAYVKHMSAYVRIHQHTSAYVSTRQHTLGCGMRTYNRPATLSY
jgi:hypothetical protein